MAVSRPISTLRPRNSNRATTYAGSRPTQIVTIVDTTACHRVNQTTSQVCERRRVSLSAWPVTASARSVPNGQA